VGPGVGVSKSRRKHTARRRRDLQVGANKAGNWGPGGSVVWFICSVCSRRIGVYKAGSDGVNASLAELVLARYGEPPVCSDCTPAESVIHI
jgi:hypothetical protein